MKTFYSILSVNIRPEINERLSLGLLMICGDKVLFRYSVSKLTVIQKLIGKDVFKATQNYLKLVETSAASNKAIFSNKSALPFKIESKYDRLFSDQYIEYLSRYNNNLISFSKPNFIDLEASEQIFRLLFDKFIGVEKIADQATYRRIDRFKKQYYPNVKSFFNIEQEISPAQYSGLLTPVKIDLLGKNDIEVFAQSIDFEKKIFSIECNIGSLLQIYRALPNAKQFVIGYEPDKIMDINHRIWDNVRRSSEFEYVDISEAEKITEYAISHSVTPLFD